MIREGEIDGHADNIARYRILLYSILNRNRG
jgi:hypothetical protein